MGTGRAAALNLEFNHWLAPKPEVEVSGSSACGILERRWCGGAETRTVDSHDIWRAHTCLKVQGACSRIYFIHITFKNISVLQLFGHTFMMCATLSIRSLEIILTYSRPSIMHSYYPQISDTAEDYRRGRGLLDQNSLRFRECP